MKFTKIYAESIDIVKQGNLEAGDNIEKLLIVAKESNTRLHNDLFSIIQTHKIAKDSTCISSFVSALEELSIR